MEKPLHPPSPSGMVRVGAGLRRLTFHQQTVPDDLGEARPIDLFVGVDGTVHGLSHDLQDRHGTDPFPQSGVVVCVVSEVVDCTRHSF